MIPKTFQESLGSRMWAVHHESAARDVGGGQFGDAPRQGIETPGIHAVRQHVLAVVSQAVARAFACLPSANHKRVFSFLQAELHLLLFNLRLQSDELLESSSQAAHAATAKHSTFSTAHLPETGQTSPSSGQITFTASVRPKYARTSAGVPFQRS